MKSVLAALFLTTISCSALADLQMTGYGYMYYNVFGLSLKSVAVIRCIAVLLGLVLMSREWYFGVVMINSFTAFSTVTDDTLVTTFAAGVGSYLVVIAFNALTYASMEECEGRQLRSPEEKKKDLKKYVVYAGIYCCIMMYYAMQ